MSGSVLSMFLQSINPTIGAAIVAAMTALILGIWTQYVLKKRELDDVHREKKIQIYENFINIAAAHLAQNNENLKQKQLSHAKVVESIFRFKTDLILRGSVGVIQAVANFEVVSNKGGWGCSGGG